MSARTSGRQRQTGKMGLKLALVSGIVTALVVVVIGVVLVAKLDSLVPSAKDDEVSRVRLTAILLGVVAGLVVAIVVYFQAAALAQRLRDLGSSVAKFGRGTEVRVRVSGNDEITALGRSMQYLAADLATLGGGTAEESAMAAAFDPQLREYRDRTVPHGFPPADGLEVDGAISDGTRGGLDYFDVVEKDGRVCLFLVSAEGASAPSAIGARLARDELLRALQAGANGRKALSHTNRVLHKNLPRGACAKASLIDIGEDDGKLTAKVYQAGGRVPVLLCARGEVREIEAEGLALGLDEGPVFEKGLKPHKAEFSGGMRFALVNEAGYRNPDLVDLIEEHSPKHTAPFMNMVLGAVEQGSGEEGLREDVVLVTVKKS